MGTPNLGLLFSASQITLFRECQRKWAWRYLAGIKTPQHPAAALGTEVDDEQLQPYFREERGFDFTKESGSGYIAAAGLGYFPSPRSPGLEVQKHFILPSPTWIDGVHVGFGIQGYMDLWLPDSLNIPGKPDRAFGCEVPEHSGGVPFVGDFKTTGDRKWVKTHEQLAVDVQAMTYATAAMYLTRADRVDLAWMYFQTKGPRKVKRTFLRVHADHVVGQFKEINDTALELKRVRDANPNPLDLPPNVEMCGSYGGCPYQSKCYPNLSPAEIIAAEEAKANRGQPGVEPMSTTSNVLAALKAKKAAQGGAPPVVPPPPPPSPGLPPPTPSPPPAVPTIEEHVATNPAAAWMLQEPAALPINPPESALPPAPPVGVTTAPAEAPKKRGRPAKSATAESIPPPDNFVSAATSPPIDIKELAKAVVDELVARLAGAA